MKTSLWLLISTLVCSATTAWAAPIDAEPQDGAALVDSRTDALWINVGGFSTHFNRDKGFNESNAGFGIEYRVNPEVSIMVGSYYNSIRLNTSYAAVNWQPVDMGSWKLGAALGLMDGYPAIQRGGTFFVALPMATYEGKMFGLNVGLIPNMQNVDGAVIVQFKLRVR